MPRIAKLSKTAIAERLISVFEGYGYEGASLKMLSDAAGLSKASLYHHFPNGKEDMAAHVLGQAGVRLQGLVLAPLADSGTAAERLIASLEGTAAYYGGSVPVCLMNSLLIGGGTRLFGEQVKVAVDIWRQGLKEAYREVGVDATEAGAWATYAVERIQGALVLCRVQANRVPLESCLAELRADVEFT